MKARATGLVWPLRMAMSPTFNFFNALNVAALLSPYGMMIVIIHDAVAWESWKNVQPF